MPLDLILTNARIIDVESGNIQANQSIGIAADRIKIVKAALDPDDFSDPVVVDLDGKYVMPGLWDMHVHLRGGDKLIRENESFLGLFLANGVTGIRDAGGDMTHAILTWRKDIGQKRLLGPQIFTAGPKFDGPDPSWPGSIEVENRSQIQAGLDSLKAMGGIDFIKVYDSKISRENYLAVLEEAEKRNFLTSGHMPHTVRLMEAVGSGLDAVEHLFPILQACSPEEERIVQDHLSGRKTSFFEALTRFSEHQAPALQSQVFAQLAERGTAVIPTLFVSQLVYRLDSEPHGHEPELMYIPPAIRETYRGREESARRRPPEINERMHKVLDQFMGMVAPLKQANVRILAGSDCGAYNSYVFPGFSLHDELALLVEAGLSPLEALQAATIEGARFMGREADFGSLAEGKMADMVVLSRNPLEDIQATRDIEAVIRQGVLHDRYTLDDLLKERENWLDK
ncbi:MAG: amidohydrolase family protein [Bacteroidota bacterium]